MHLTWTPNASASALHAAQSICAYGDKLADARIAESIGRYALGLGQWIESAAPFDAARFWSLLIGHSAMIDSNTELAQAVVRKAAIRVADKTAISQLAGFISDIEAAYNQLFPKFHEQLPLRARPLQEHWLGFGPGLLAHLGRLTQKDLLVSEARVTMARAPPYAKSNRPRSRTPRTNRFESVPSGDRFPASTRGPSRTTSRWRHWQAASNPIRTRPA